MSHGMTVGEVENFLRQSPGNCNDVDHIFCCFSLSVNVL